MNTGEKVEPTYWIVLRYVFDLETPFAFATILCGVMSVMLNLFFGYHVYMAIQNTTTNERAKKSDFKMYFNKKIELCEEWEKNFHKEEGYKISEEDLKMFTIDE